MLLAGSGCGLSSVDVTRYDAQPGTAQVCKALLDALPTSIGNAARRKVSASAALSTAWGDPPIVLRCGVPTAPRELGAELYPVDDVDWTVDDGTGGRFFSTVGRTATVEVAVPSRYAPEANVLTDLAAAIKQTDPVTPAP